MDARRRLFLLLVLALVGCKAADPFTLRIAAIGPFGPVSPGDNNFYSLLVSDLAYETLLVLNEQGEPSPSLARAWRPLPAGHVWIELDPQGRFSDGSPITLEDVIASLKAAGFSSTPMERGLDVAPPMSGVPAEFSLTRSGIFKSLPSGILASGRFVLVRQDRDRLVLRRVKNEPHRITTVEFVAYPSLRAAVAAVLRGDCSACLLLAQRTSEFFDGMPNLQLISGPAIQRTAILFNHKTVSNNERGALLRALQAADLESVMAGNGRKTHDVTAALGPGQPLSILTWNADSPTQRVALAVRALLGQRAGPLLELSPAPANIAFAASQFDLVVTPVLGWPETEALALWHTGGPYSPTGYSNPALDEAVQARDWAAARHAFDLDPPGLFLGPRERLVVIDSRIRNAQLGRNGVLYLLPSWEVP